MPFSDAVTAGLLEAATRAGIELLILDNRYDPSTAIRVAEEFVARRVDLVIEFQIDHHVAPVIADRISTASIPIIAVDVPHPNAIYFGVDNYRVGFEAGGLLADYAAQAWRGRVARVLGLDIEHAGTLVQSRITGSFRAIQDRLPEIALSSYYRLDGAGVQDKTARAVAEFLRRCPNDRCILISAANDTSALGALHAVRELRREGDVAIVGQDCIPAALEEMTCPGSPWIGSVSHEAASYGPALIRLALSMLQGATVAPYNYVEHRLITAEALRSRAASGAGRLDARYRVGACVRIGMIQAAAIMRTVAQADRLEQSSALRSDIRHALQMFGKNPGFSVAALAALTLGIGANTAVFTVVNAVLLKPLRYPNADRMVNFLFSASGIAQNRHCVAEYYLFQRQTHLFREVIAFDNAGPGFNLTSGRPEQVSGIHVTEGYFRMYGAPVVLGRTFTPQEDSPHGGKVVVLSYGLWQRRFGGDRAIAGQSISLGNEPYAVVGVIGKEFVGDVQADLWLPFQIDPASNDGNVSFYVTGLLQPGVTVAQANAQLQAVAPEFRREFPNLACVSHFRVGPLLDSIVGDARNSLLILLGAVGFVLLIACANVANLLLAHATVRRREFAIRSALGASRARILRLLLTETVLLSAGGGILGTAVGFAGVRTLLAVGPAGLPRIGENGTAIGIDWRVLGFTLAVSLLTGILFGLVPAFSASRSDLISTLKESDNRSGTGFRQGKARTLLVLSEIALALVLLIGAALLIRTWLALHAIHPGFDAHHVLTMEMSLNGPRYQKTAGIAQLLQDGRNRVNALPGVELAAAGFWLPNDVEDGTGFQIAGRPVADRSAIRHQVIWQGMRLALAGVALGIPASARAHAAHCGPALRSTSMGSRRLRDSADRSCCGRVLRSVAAGVTRLAAGAASSAARRVKGSDWV